MTTNVLIVNRGLNNVEVSDYAGQKRVLYPGSYTDLCTCHDSRPLEVKEVSPTEKGASTPK